MNSALPIDMVSDVVCPWCFIGKRRLEKAIALLPDVPVVVRFRPYFLNPWIPRAGISRSRRISASVVMPWASSARTARGGNQRSIASVIEGDATAAMRSVSIA